jgi:lipoyl-dependent peroxiredoxin
MQRKASVQWSGGIKDGKGLISTQSGALQSAPYGFLSRFEGRPGTSPEELIGAAHAACFSMALAMALERENMRADSIDTVSTVTLEQDGDGFTITACYLDVSAKVPNVDIARFESVAQAAKNNCPVSKLLNANITMAATLLP